MERVRNLFIREQCTKWETNILCTFDKKKQVWMEFGAIVIVIILL